VLNRYAFFAFGEETSSPSVGQAKKRVEPVKTEKNFLLLFTFPPSLLF
jgi:hypothetical protein